MDFENDNTLDAESVDDYVAELVSERPAGYADFLSEDELQKITQRYNEAIAKGTELDALDIGLAASCGVISGLIDALFASTPGEGPIDAASDALFEQVVQVFAERTGWNPKPGNEDNVKAAIRFLEKQLGIAHNPAAGQQIAKAVVRFAMKNHTKSLSRHLGLIGLIASICSQFTGTSTSFGAGQGGLAFVGDAGQRMLFGDSFTAKVFAGVVNWLGQSMSDAVSGGAKGRGSGLPVPLSEFLGRCDFGTVSGEPSQWQAFANVMAQVYEQGYDLRHGASMTVPVVLNDLLIRVVYVLRQHYDKGLDWADCLPKEDCPELDLMLAIGVGTMCLVDLGHAAATSWGDWMAFFTKLNLAAWARFGLCAVSGLEMEADRGSLF